MKSLSRVVWSEGMYLGTHQFQVQARYMEDSIHFATSSLWPFQFGLTGCQMDAEALRNGTISIVHARGILPDGTPFNAPECDPLPAPRSITDVFPPTSDSVAVALVIPERRPQGPNLGTSPDTRSTGARSARYFGEDHLFPDENTGGDERSVRLGRKNFQLHFEMEPREGQSGLALGRVRRDGSGHFLYDPEFIPCSLQIGAGETLMRLLHRLIEILESKSATLGGAAGSGTTRDFSSREVANFWLLHAVNSALPPLRHLWISKRGHPEELFLELSRLAGALCTFTLGSNPAALPAYDHVNPGPCFAALDTHIRTHLETVVPTNCLSIPLQKTAEYFYAGDITDTRVLGRSRWIFAIRSSLGEVPLITRTPQLVKVCSAKFIGELVRRAIAGLPLRHLPVPPAAVPAKVETQYFSVSKEGPFWDNIVQTRRVGIYVPGDLPAAELELLVVLDA